MEQVSFYCGKCGGKMVKGFIVDYSQDTFMPSYWVEGEPEHAKLLGITGANLDIRGRKKFTVKALRCEKCGYLESYAV